APISRLNLAASQTPKVSTSQYQLISTMLFMVIFRLSMNELDVMFMPWVDLEPLGVLCPVSRSGPTFWS
ncbi:hypothetical protein HAX54_049044, partial [Datura stramonium]|nr:hypothetical protein [Datura stramonium]